MNMDRFGINIGFLFVQLCLGLGWLALVLGSLFHLRSKKLTGTPLALWALTICVVPVLGALAYWIIRPSADSQ
jgi:hypothetical protein